MEAFTRPTLFIEPLIYVDEKRLLDLKITTALMPRVYLCFLLACIYIRALAEIKHYYYCLVFMPVPYQTDDNADEYLEMLG